MRPRGDKSNKTERHLHRDHIKYMLLGELHSQIHVSYVNEAASKMHVFNVHKKMCFGVLGLTGTRIERDMKVF